MEEDDSKVRECFAYFGRIIYITQGIEKGILNLLILNYQNISKLRFDEIFAEKSKLTFGQLKREVIEKKILDATSICRMEWFHEIRDWLVHNYWWERAVEFYRDDLRHKIVEELDTLAFELDNFNSLIDAKCQQILQDKGINISTLFQSLAMSDKTPNSIKSLRKLTKDETLIGLYMYKEDGMQIPIFEMSDNTLWTLCECGLSLVENIKKESLNVMIKTTGIFPVKQFNPCPKIINEEWDYELDLKKDGLRIIVKPQMLDKKFIYTWSITKM